MVKITSFKKDVEILENLPQVLTVVDEIKAVANVEDPILSSEWSLIDEAIDNQFVLTSNETGLSRYERMLGLKISDTDDVETRILRVLARYQEQAPYTNRVLIRILNSLLGVGNYTYERDVANKNISLKIDLEVKAQFNILMETLERIIPANMTFNVDLLYNNHEMLSAYTHQGLSQFTHQYLREGVLS